MRAAQALLIGLAARATSGTARVGLARARLPIRRLSAGGAELASPAAAASAAKTLRFDELPLLPGTQSALKREFGYEVCSPVQQAAIPLGLAGYDLLARAQTGTGKTLAFLIPAIERHARVRTTPPLGCASVLILAPTRELAQQTAREAERLCAHLVPAVTVQAMIGGTALEKEKARIGRAGLGNILVATPGRLTDHLQNTAGFAKRLAPVHTLVLDEVDQLLDGGFRTAVERIVRALPAPATRQTLLFSATLSDEIRAVARAAMRAGEASRTVDCVGAGAQDATAALLEQRFALCSQEELMPRLWEVLRAARQAGQGKVIVFCPTAKLTQLAARLAQLEDPALSDAILEIHSRKSQSSREKTSGLFRRAQSAVLFTSDVSARGVDYPDVSLVVQLGCPATREQYVHRTGRSARAGKGGAGLLLLCDYERPFLEELKGLPIVEAGEADAFWPAAGAARARGPDEAARRRRLAPVLGGGGGGGVDAAEEEAAAEALGEQAYQSWLGFYRGLCKALRWSNEDLVRTANRFATSIGFDEPPALELRVINKMGLKGTAGLRVGKPRPKPARASPAGGGGGGVAGSAAAARPRGREGDSAAAASRGRSAGDGGGGKRVTTRPGPASRGAGGGGGAAAGSRSRGGFDAPLSNAGGGGGLRAQPQQPGARAQRGAAAAPRASRANAARASSGGGGDGTARRERPASAGRNSGEWDAPRSRTP